MWISANSTPDFRTINFFRGKRLKGEIQKLFSEVVRMLHELNYVNFEVQYIDGTKIESASDKYTFVWRGSVEKYKAKLEDKIQSVLTEIDSQTKEDSKEINKQQTPRRIDSKELKEKLAELNLKLKESSKATQKQLAKLQEEYLPRLDKYENDPQSNNQEKLLPILSSQRMNAYLKEIATVCEIEKELTFHNCPAHFCNNCNAYKWCSHRKCE